MKIVGEYLNEQALVAELIAQTSPEPEVVRAFASIAEHFRQLAEAMDNSTVIPGFESGNPSQGM